MHARLFLKFWFPLAAYSAIIFYVSSLTSSSLSLTTMVWDKLLHTLEYTILGFLAARAFGAAQSFWPPMALWAIVTAFCFVYGLTDEFHQSFVPGRESTFSDACADFLGGAIGAGIYLIANQLFANFKKEGSTHVSA